MNFASDNTAGIAPEILQALVAGNDGFAMGYGNDDVTRAVERRIGEIFERDAAVFLVPTGTAANALALAHVSPPWGAVFAHAEAHILTDECGAPEFFGGGLKLVGMPGVGCKVTPETLAETRVALRGPRAASGRAGGVLVRAGERGRHDLPAGRDRGAGQDRARARHEGPHGRRALCQRAGADEREPGRDHLEVRRRCAVVRRHQGRRAWRRRRWCSSTASSRRTWPSAASAPGICCPSIASSRCSSQAFLANDCWLRLARHANAMADRLAAGLDRRGPSAGLAGRGQSRFRRRAESCGSAAEGRRRALLCAAQRKPAGAARRRTSA